jgi:hypothetical protein
MRVRSWVVAVVAVSVAVVTVSAAVIVVAVKGSDPAPAPAASVTLEPAVSAGADPFTASVAGGPIQVAGTARAKSAAFRKTLSSDRLTHTLVVTGTAPGLYGGSGNVHVCDPQQLVTFLAQHPDKAAAWARVLAIAPANIAGYVATLTPVLLTGDTLVGNHGYRGGVATLHLSVLQAGTAVMVDATGTPRVKCNCGNPLTSPQLITLSKANTRGVAWPGYAPAAVTAVRPGTAAATLTLVNVGTGDTYDQSTASGAGLWVAAEVTNTSGAPRQTTIVTSSDGQVWTPAGVIPGETVQALAWGNGTWIATVSTGTDAGSPVLESTDLHTWRLVATLPDLVLGVAYGNGRWTAVGSLRSVNRRGVVWGSTDAVHWARVATTNDDGDGAISHVLSSVAYSDGDWIAVASDWTQSATDPYVLKTFTSIDGIRWAPNGGSINGATNGQIAYGAGHWTIAATTNIAAQSVAAERSGVNVSVDGRSWVAKPIVGVGRAVTGALAYGNGTWLAAGRTNQVTTGGAQDDGSSTFLASGDGTTWSPVTQVAESVQALAFGGASTLNGLETPTSPATTTPAGTSTESTPPSSTPSPAVANVGTTFAGTWGAHEMRLVIDQAGTGHLSYADLALCPKCSFANAPLGTVDFVLTSVTNGVATGRVTATSDPKNDAIGALVHAKLTPGSPGQLLEVDIGGTTLVSFCNSTSAGQCGA